MPEERPNVVFVILDTARASAFDTDSTSSSRTPTYARLASRGTEFAHAVTPAPWTFPSHVSFFSGLMPSVHGLMGDAWEARELPNVGPVVARAGDAWLPRAAHAAGYETFAAVANGWVGPRTGFDAHFDHFFTTVGGARRSAMDRARHSLRSRLHPGDDGASRLVAAFEHWHAGRDKGRPFFAFFNFLEPHAPYDPPGWRRELAAGDRRRAGALLEDLHRPADLMLPYNLGSQSLDDKDLAILRRLYEKEVSVADTAAGRVLDLLENAGEMDRTMVVLASDHGENIGEHHLLAHNMSLHETLLHVPLVIAGPGASQSHRPGTVSALGLHPTLVQVMSGREQEGSLLTHPAEDVASEYESARNQVRALGPLLKEIHRTANLPVLATHKGVAAYRGTYKAVAANHRVDVFNLSSDPVESVPLAGALVPDAKAASDAASAGLERLERRSQHTEETAVLDEEIRVHLEGLGYL